MIGAGRAAWVFRFPPAVAELRSVRRRVGEQLEVLGCDDDLAGNVTLVVDEIVNNAIEHAEDYRAAGSQLVLRVELGSGTVGLVFEDPDVPVDVITELEERLRHTQNGGPPPIDNERGRGLFLIAGFVEDLVVAPLGPQGGLRLRGRVE